MENLNNEEQNVEEEVENGVENKTDQQPTAELNQDTIEKSKVSIGKVLTAIIVAVIVLAIGGYLLNKINPEAESESVQTAYEYDGWNTYTNRE